MTFRCDVPATATVQRDDPDVRITRWDFEPGAATGWHSHGWAYFVVMLTDAVMRVHDGTQVTEVRHQAAGVEHDVMNGGPMPMAFIEIEIKHSGAVA
jgi:quercetin dioxygenase-like cupin family protein